MFGRSNQVEANLKAAVDQVAALLGARRRTQEALARAEASVPAAERVLKDAMTALGHRLADADTVSVDPTVQGAALAKDRRAVAAARDQIEAIKCAIGSLRNRLVDQEPELLKAQDEYVGAREIWVRAQLDAFKVEYAKAAEAFAAVVRKGITISDALSVYSRGLEATRIFRMHTQEEELLQITSREYDDGTAYDVPVWRDNPKLEALYASLTEQQGPRRELEEVVRGVSTKRRGADQQAAMERL